MKKKNYLIVTALMACVTLLIFSCEKKTAALEPVNTPSANACDTITYAKHIQPIIEAKCYNCHTAANGSSAGVDLDSYDKVKAIVNDGRLKSTTIDNKTMPTDGPLNDTLIQQLNCWIQKGALNN